MQEIVAQPGHAVCILFPKVTATSLNPTTMDTQLDDIEALIFGEAQLLDLQGEAPQLEHADAQRGRGPTRLQKASLGRVPNERSSRTSLPRRRAAQSSRLPQQAGCHQQEQQQQQQQDALDREHLQQQSQSAELQGPNMFEQLPEPSNDPDHCSWQHQQQQQELEDEILAAEIALAAEALGGQPHTQHTGGASSHVQKQQRLQTSYREKRPPTFAAYVARYAVPPPNSMCSCCGAESSHLAVTRCLDCSVTLQYLETSAAIMDTHADRPIPAGLPNAPLL